MPEPLFEQPSRIMRPTDRCRWCLRPGAYAEGTKCMSDYPPVHACRVHAKWTDINLIVRGRRAVIKCAHYGEGGVVLYADPSRDDSMWFTYTVQFYWPGVGQELYVIPPHRGQCPHQVFDELAAEMYNGARPHPNRVPPVQDAKAQPGESLGD